MDSNCTPGGRAGSPLLTQSPWNYRVPGTPLAQPCPGFLPIKACFPRGLRMVHYLPLTHLWKARRPARVQREEYAHGATQILQKWSPSPKGRRKGEPSWGTGTPPQHMRALFAPCPNTHNSKLISQDHILSAIATSCLPEGFRKALRCPILWLQLLRPLCWV